MVQAFCLVCHHYPVCMKVLVEARRQEIWNGDIDEFYKKQAESCSYWEEEKTLNLKEKPDKKE